MNAEQTKPDTQTAHNLHPSEATLKPSCDLIDCFRQYARQRPEVVALWCLGIGFVLGWKLKPW